MASVTLKKTATPSEEIVDDANKVVIVTDARGRRIGIKKLRMNVRRRILKVLSDEMSRKQQYLGLVMVAACVVEIDGVPEDLPSSELQFDALIDRLDDDGFEAVGAGIQKHFGVSQSKEELAEEVKN